MLHQWVEGVKVGFKVGVDVNVPPIVLCNGCLADEAPVETKKESKPVNATVEAMSVQFYQSAS